MLFMLLVFDDKRALAEVRMEKNARLFWFIVFHATGKHFGDNHRTDSLQALVTINIGC